MALENMVSQFQPQGEKKTNGLANGKGLESVTNKGSELNLDDNPILANALADGKGLEKVVNASSTLNIDSEPEESTGLANGVGLEALTAKDSELDIDTAPNKSSGLNDVNLNLGLSELEVKKVNDLSSGLAKEQKL
tara:strand:+ start:1635 stop:2042 length:408 start_codon:yes stop_codon:yes gene_type:complete